MKPIAFVLLTFGLTLTLDACAPREIPLPGRDNPGQPGTAPRMVPSRRPPEPQAGARSGARSGTRPGDATTGGARG